MSDGALDLDDIQGNILAGFNTNVEVLVALTHDGSGVDRAVTWLCGLAPQLTTIRDVKAERRSIKRPDPARPITWLCVALGAELLKRIRPVDLTIREEAFNGGLLRRSRGSLGDRTDPSGWVVGKPDAPVDVFLVVASDDETAAEARADALVAEAEAVGLRRSYREAARRIADLEHFGFRDGVSQPTVRGYDANGEFGPGHFVFGYERVPGGSPVIPAIDPNGFMKNGSFMVFRRLAQDVKAFRSFCAETAARLSQSWPGLTADHLAALLVGRWPSGALVSVDLGQDPGRQPHDNAFDFSGDPEGRCPFGAHIRKVNPRNGPKDLTEVPRLLRRGIPFGRPFDHAPDEPRGLAFISFQTSIRQQLETLTGTWMNSPFRPATGSGHDLLVGRAPGERSMTITGPHGRVVISDERREWVTPTGGAYLFVPGRLALSRLNIPTARAGLWQLRKLVAAAGDGFRVTVFPSVER